jgi:hypothetical protein
MNNIIDSISNYYNENSDNVNKYMFITMNIFVLYFYPYLYFISYIIISYQKLQIDFSITVSNNKISIDKLVFKNIDDDEDEDTQVNTLFNFNDDNYDNDDDDESHATNVSSISVPAMPQQLPEQNNTDDTEEIESVINEEDITSIENQMSLVYDSIMNA